MSSHRVLPPRVDRGDLLTVRGQEFLADGDQFRRRLAGIDAELPLHLHNRVVIGSATKMRKPVRHFAEKSANPQVELSPSAAQFGTCVSAGMSQRL
jgi:hypothetical protein